MTEPEGAYGNRMEEAEGESTRRKCLLVLVERIWTRRGWRWVANDSLETGAALLNDEGGEELDVMFERSVRVVRSNLGSDLGDGEGAGIVVGGVCCGKWKFNKLLFRDQMKTDCSDWLHDGLDV